MTTTEALEKIADLLDQNGWCQGRLQDEEGRLCLVGAINEVAFGNLWEPKLMNGIVTAIMKELEVDSSLKLVEYNNDLSRTKEEVITMVRNAKRWCDDND